MTQYGLNIIITEVNPLGLALCVSRDPVQATMQTILGNLIRMRIKDKTRPIIASH